MNTLHLCHWRNRKHFNSHIGLIGKQDGLIIYGLITLIDEQWISQNLMQSTFPWHLVKQQLSPNNNKHEIDNEIWLNLIIEYKNTLAWK